MTCSRWIRVCVDTFDHPALEGPYDRRSAWLWLIANAAWKEKRVRVSGKLMALERGQVVVGRDHLAEVWGWGVKQVRNFLAELEAENMIEMGHSKGRIANVATICNYDKYQSTGPVEGRLEDQLEAGSGPVRGHTVENNTKDTKLEGEITRASEPPSVEDPVRVNCKAIYGPGFTLDFKAIDMSGALYGITSERARAIAEICARDWATKSMVPDHPMALVNAAIASDKNKSAIQSVRLERAASAPERRRPPDDDPEALAERSRRINEQLRRQFPNQGATA